MRRNRFRPAVETLEGRLTPATLQPGFAEAVVAGGLGTPTAMEFAPDGRLFVAEQTGDLRVIQNGALLPQPFVHLNVDSSGERGLLGIAFDPNFASDHFVYLYHTVPASGGTPAFNRVSRFTANGNVAVPGSEVPILDLPGLGPTNHNGGAIHFGTDGKLYVGVGENGTPGNSQSLNTPLGKLLRINPDGSIPPNNPFVGQTTGINQAVWALGLRNPFTFAVQPGSGMIFINDVGQSTWEEIDRGIAGANYGWPNTEGPFDPNNPANAGFTEPIFYYGHGAGTSLGAAIVGGTFYDPPAQQFPADYAGTYFFSDWGNGWIRRLDPATGAVTLFASGIPSPVDLKVDAAGNLYYLAQNGGSGFVARVSFVGGQNQRYVAALYQNLLRRAPEPGALSAWTSLLDQGAPRSAVVQGIQNSTEHEALVVQTLYQQILRRAADPGGLQTGVQFLARGGTAERLESILLGSDEYFVTRGGGSNAGFLQALYPDTLGRPLDPAGAQSAGQALAQGASRQLVAQAVLASRESDTDEVVLLYRLTLHRDPDAGGLNAATNMLLAGVPNETLQAILLESDEFYAGA